MITDKIYELAKQADLIEFDSIPGSKAVTPTYESMVKARQFAELIIQQCQLAVVSRIDCSAVEAIKEHFGVTYGQSN